MRSAVQKIHPAPFRTHKDIIEALGVRAVAAQCGKQDNAVHHWKARGIPGDYWHLVCELAARMAMPISPAFLAEIRPPSRRTK